MLDKREVHRFRPEWLGPAIVLALLCVAFALPVLDPAVQLFDRDTGRCEMSFKLEMWKRLSHFELPLWFPWVESGTSLLGQMTPALFHPLTLLYLLLPFELAFKLNHLAALPLAMWGMYRLARRLGASPWAACAGAAAFGGSGWIVSMTASNVHYALGLASIPLAVDALLALLEGPRPLRLLWAGFTLALPMLAGEPQSGVFCGVLCVLFAAHRVSTRAVRPGFALRCLALWGVCGVLLSGPATFPVVARLADTKRSEGRSEVEASTFTVKALRLAGLALPWVLDETMEQLTPAVGRSPFSELSLSSSDTPFCTSIALGLPVLLLALLALGQSLGRRLWLVALLCVLASLGSALPVERALLFLLPPLRVFRYSEKWLAPATFLLTLAAALGADALARSRKLVPALLGLATALGLVGLAAHGNQALVRFVAQHMHGGREAVAALTAQDLSRTLLTQTGLLLALAGAFLPQAASPLLPALTRALPALTCALGAWLATANVLFVAPLEALRTKPFLAQEMEAKAGPSAGRWRIDSDPDHGVSLGDFDWRLGLSQWELNALTPQFNALFGIETAAIYSSLIRRDYVTAWHAAPQAMGVLFGVRFNLVPGWRVTPQQARAAGFTATALGMWVRELPPQPRVFLAPCVQPEGTFEEAARALAEPGFDVHTRALEFVPGQRAVPGARGECDPAHRQPPLLAVSHPRPERFDVHLQAPTPGMLVLSEEYDPGWTRSLDGGPFEPAARVDLAALGTYVTQGEHQLAFRFWPVGLTPGLLAALSVLLATLAAHLVRTPRSESSSPVRFR